MTFALLQSANAEEVCVAAFALARPNDNQTTKHGIVERHEQPTELGRCRDDYASQYNPGPGTTMREQPITHRRPTEGAAGYNKTASIILVTTYLLPCAVIDPASQPINKNPEI
ncbi:hypothetical protein V6N13_092851 [Hibiscus sabdariffa]|uniref:Uncharacterized protein n=2 Tax=Hibiscus sabdariffa TaxID=183260 RepID=A0ABR2AMQ7_9ROSI